MEVEMSTGPWRRIVCVCNYADQWVLYLLGTLPYGAVTLKAWKGNRRYGIVLLVMC